MQSLVFSTHRYPFSMRLLRILCISAVCCCVLTLGTWPYPIPGFRTQSSAHSAIAQLPHSQLYACKNICNVLHSAWLPHTPHTAIFYIVHILSIVDIVEMISLKLCVKCIFDICGPKQFQHPKYIVLASLLGVNLQGLRLNSMSTARKLHINTNIIGCSWRKIHNTTSVLRPHIHRFTKRVQFVEIWRCCPLQGPAATEPWPV